MHKDSMRKTGAFLLALTVWSSAFAFYPASAAAQTAEKKQDDKKVKKQPKTEKVKKEATPTAQTQTNVAGGLTEKENPALIGKRKINSGSDKFFGWLGG